MKFFRRKALLRFFAVFFTVEILANSIVPTISWALTAGPTAPEFSSFEPVDTTDMVNLATGEFVYNMPLFEVPGPSGGYPLSLSYHAGIKPDQEASWVGLGWTLNPGAINRNVNGFADDNFNVRRETRDYWDGGETTTKTFTIGISLPFHGLSLNYTLAKTQDTFKGFSKNAIVGLSFNPVTFGSKMLGSSIVGDSFTKAPARRTTEEVYRNEMYSNASGWLAAGTSLDVTMSSRGIKSSASVGGKQLNPKSGGYGSVSRYSTSTDKGMLDLLKFGSLSLRDYYTRYWSDQADALYSYGPLYFGENVGNEDHYQDIINDANYGFDEFRTYANDVYDLPDFPWHPPLIYDQWDQADPKKQIGGSLPSFDQFVVTGQGVGGVIEPYIFENGSLKGQNLYQRSPLDGKAMTNYPTVKYKSLKQFTQGKKVDFRFKGDFSNSLTMTPGEFSGSFSDQSPLSENQIISNADGYDGTASRQKLAGSRNIEWFTNEEIRNGNAKQLGFIDFYTNANDRPIEKEIFDNYLQPEMGLPIPIQDKRGIGSGLFTTDLYPAEFPTSPGRYAPLKPKVVSLNKKIGGFMITNESGVTYHYALPVYGYNEYTRLKEKKPLKGSAVITEVKNNEPYAYTWLLTAITGPDFVDRGGEGDLGNGILDDEDFGYWVKFDYGKWTDSYQWRTPDSKYMSDFESEYESFSYGIKELYYLDAIETKSHKALFVKSKRKDGRGVTSRLEGGSNPRKYTITYRFDEKCSTDPNATAGRADRGHLVFSVSPVSTLKLDAIYLFKKSDLGELNVTKAGGDKYDNGPHQYLYRAEDGSPQEGYRYPPKPLPAEISITPGVDGFSVKYHNGDLVLDDEDIQGTANFRSKALKIIELDTDYSLAQGVTNSFNNFSDLGRPCAFPSYCPPEPRNFDFEWPSQISPYQTTASPDCCDPDNYGSGYSHDRVNFYSRDPITGFNFTGEGDFLGNSGLTYTPTGKLTLNGVRTLGHGGAEFIPATTFVYEKNPNYTADRYDEWGYYKNDYQQSSDPQNRFATRRITNTSARDVDAWSLTKVNTPMGGSLSIKYEANTFSKSVYNNNDIFSIRDLTMGLSDHDRIKVTFKETGINVNSFFAVGDAIDLRALVINRSIGSYYPHGNFYTNFEEEITGVGSDYIEVLSPRISLYLQTGPKTIDGIFYNSEPYFVAGSVMRQGDTMTNKFAGGVRVQSISFNEFDGHTRSTHYSYNKPGTEISSGVTSFKPFNAIGINYSTDIEYFRDVLNRDSWEENRLMLIDYKTQFTHSVNRLYEDILIFGREAPAPGAMYEFVTVQEKYNGNNAPQYEQNHFKVFDEGMLSIDRQDYQGNVDTRQLTVTNNAIDVGNLLEVNTYSESNYLLHTTRYGFLYDQTNESFENSQLQKKQGVVQQAFHKYVGLKEYKTEANHAAEILYQKEKLVVTSKIERSNVITSVEEIDHKLGKRAKTEYHDFDFFGGQPTQTLAIDGYGNRYLTVTTPAYRVPNYSGMSATQVSSGFIGMGLKLKNQKNTHMLSQVAETTTSKVNSSNQPIGLVSSSIQTWSDKVDVIQPGALSSRDAEVQRGIWRKDAEYSFIGNDIQLNPDGLYPQTSFAPFVAWEHGAEAPNVWQRNTELSLYDVQSNGLEARDINGDLAATRMDPNFEKVIATATLSSYDGFACTGFESSLTNTHSGGVTFGSAQIVGNYKHTGQVSAKLNGDGIGLQSQIEISSAYKPSVEVQFWLHKPTAGSVALSYNFTESASSSSAYEDIDIDLSICKSSGDWYLCEVSVPVPVVQSNTPHIFYFNSRVKNRGATPVYIDDIRIRSSRSAIVSYAYKETGEVSHILNDKNLFTEYIYDDMGRLTEVHVETFQMGNTKISETRYRYAGQQ